MIPNRLCSSYSSVTVLCALSYTIKRIVAHRRASQAIHGRIPCPWQSAQKIPTVHIPCKTHRYTHKKEAVRNIIYLWQHDETAVPDFADSTAPLINSCFKSRLLRHLSTSSFQRYLNYRDAALRLSSPLLQKNPQPTAKLPDTKSSHFEHSFSLFLP